MLLEAETSSETEPMTEVAEEEVDWASLVDKYNGHLRNVDASNHFEIVCYYTRTFYPYYPP